MTKRASGRTSTAIPRGDTFAETSGRALSAEVRAVMTALTLARDPSPTPTTLRARILGSTARGGGFGLYADRIARLFDWTVAHAERELARLEERDAWGPGLMDGMALIPAPCGARFATGVASFGRFEPGVRFPRHSHAGGELTVVLAGALRDSSGTVVARGDELAVDADAAHEFVILDRGPCIAAAIAYRGIDLV